jgi:zinc D-Ala-D-Ala dipeptidase
LGLQTRRFSRLILEVVWVRKATQYEGSRRRKRQTDIFEIASIIRYLCFAMTALCSRCFFMALLVFSQGCDLFTSEKPAAKPPQTEPDTAASYVIPPRPVVDTAALRKIEPGELERSIIAAGLVDIHSVDSTIVVDLKYSSTDNFLGMDVYGDLENCYLQPEVADKLALAQLFLKTRYPYYNIVVYDGARPRRIQQLMWDTIQVPPSERPKYLSNPRYGSLHNYGAAVDVSIVNEDGIALDMGTPYDYFGELAYPEREEVMVKEGKLTYRQVLNRYMLRTVMEKAGFFNIQTEWWHFNSCYRSEAMIKYRIVE